MDLDKNFPLTECEILFGNPNNNDIKIQIINFLILLTVLLTTKKLKKRNCILLTCSLALYLKKIGWKYYTTLYETIYMCEICIINNLYKI